MLINLLFVAIGIALFIGIQSYRLKQFFNPQLHAVLTVVLVIAGVIASLFLSNIWVMRSLLALGMVALGYTLLNNPKILRRP